MKPNFEDRKARRRRLTERLETLRERAQLIELELDEFTKDHFRVVIFGSARIKPHDSIYEMTKELAFDLGKAGIDVLTGGGPGLMEAGNLGVKEGRELSGAKSKSFGISIQLNQFEPANPHIDVKHHHKRFSSRLDDFMRLSNVVVVTPGGIGTSLELFFSWQLLQVGHIAERPIILMRKEFWSGLIDWVKDVLIERGLVSPGDLRWIHVVDTPAEAMEIIQAEQKKFDDLLAARGK